MILKTAHVTNFKCIKDSTPFSLDKDVTCLVGKNEAGKTAILEALHKLRPVRDEDGKFDVTKEYFRPSVLDYKPVHATAPDTAVRTTWELEDEDRKALEPLIGPAAQKVGPVTILKRFDDKVLVEFDLDEADVVQGLLKASDLESKEKGKFKAAPTVKDLAAQLSAAPEEQQQRNALVQEIKKRFGDKTARDAAADMILARIPRIPATLRGPQRPPHKARRRARRTRARNRCPAAFRCRRSAGLKTGSFDRAACRARNMTALWHGAGRCCHRSSR